MSGPLTRILDAFGAGAASLAEVEAATGLSADVVAASVDHLVRLGRLDVQRLTLGCPSGGCGACASGTAGGAASCGARGPSSGRRGSALVALTLRRPGTPAAN